MDRSSHVPSTSLAEFCKQPLRLRDMNLNQSPPCCSAYRGAADRRPEGELKDNSAARKVQKADREKLRRDRLNEQFAELGSILDPDRPKNDKASIIVDTIQMVKELTDQVCRLKDEYASLTEQYRELTQEKNDLREEKATIKSDIESLNAEYQQRLRTMYPWAGVEHPLVMRPPLYPYPLPIPIPTGPIPMQPYPFYGNQNPTAIPSHCSTFVPYMTTPNPILEQPIPHVSPVVLPGSRNYNGSNKQESKNKADIQTSDESSNEVETDLELKTPGSTSEQVSSSAQKGTGKRSMEKNSLADGSSSLCSSSHSVQVFSSSSVIGDTKKDEKPCREA
ncbi:hypothetical protein DM860_003270 [Cuscuta australis]|uniref:BHLH domain-containing protein n=1 Tax=Cuscuta australis TaxID=267555 RepID=A0A328D1T6_9ASTE|nr:hypothetical protein DM860_003270 [Cuscuta australis]